MNDAPSGANATVTVIEDSSYFFTTADFGFTDLSDSPANALTSVIITSLPASGQLIYFFPNGAPYPIPPGFELSAGDLIGHGRLGYYPAADANGNGYASFTFQVRDNADTANGGIDLDPTPNTITINVTEVNDAPVAVGETLASIAEDSGVRVISFASLLGNDSTGPANESGQTLTITAVSNVVGGTAVINGTNIAFTPTANYNGPASFEYTVRDNGQTNGVDDFKTAVATASFTITEVNDAPVAVGETLASIAEDSGVRVISFASLLGNDSTGPANESGQTLTITAVSNVVGGTAVINGTNIAFTPTANYNGPASFEYTVRDNGQTNGVDDFKTATATASFTISAVNDAPSGGDTTVTALEDTAFVFRAANFGFTDPNDLPANVLAAVKIASLPGAGALKLNGVTQSAAGFEVSAADLAAGKLTFAPVANANGNAYAAFSFQVRDNGGTANGGLDLDPTPNTLTINVTAVNDAPVNTLPLARTVAENTLVTITGVSVSDVDVAAGNILVTLSVGHGALSFTNQPGISGDLNGSDGSLSLQGSLAAVNAALATLGYRAASNYNGSDTLHMVTSDLGNSGQGGALTDSDDLSITVSAVNTAPQGLVILSDSTPTQNAVLSVSNTITDADGLGPFTYAWQQLVNGAWTDIATGATFTPGASQVGSQLRVDARYTDLGGTAEHVTSAATSAVGGEFSGAGNFVGTAGDDVFISAPLKNAYNGGAGNDTVSFANAGPDGVRVDLLNGVGAQAYARNDTYTSIENVIGSNQGDLLIGNNVANRLEGGGGNDTLTGNGGADAFAFSFPVARAGVAAGIDIVTDFSHALGDYFEISASGFGGGLVAGGTATIVNGADLAAATLPSGGYFFFDQSGAGIGDVYWDSNGAANGSSDAVKFATLQNTAANGVTVLTAVDFHIVT